MRPVPVLRQEVSVNNAGRKYIGRQSFRSQHSHSNVLSAFAQIVGTESYTLNVVPKTGLKVQRVSRCIALLFLQSRSQMGLCGQSHAPAVLPTGKTRYPLYKKLGGPQGRSRLARKILRPTGIRSPDRPTPQRVTIPTELSRPTVHIPSPGEYRTHPSSPCSVNIFQVSSYRNKSEEY